MEQGKVIIGCRLDSKQLEKDLKNSEKELQKYEKEAEKLTEAKAKIDIDLQEYEKQKQLIQASTDETLKLAQTEEQVKNVLDLEKMELEELNQKYSAQFQKQSEINKKIEDNAISQSMLNDKIQETSQKLKQVKGFEQIKNEINEVNKGLTKTIKNAGKWALGIFGIRSAYNAVRSAMSTLSQYDDQMASNIQYITYALANTLKPVIETILNLIVKLLQYINYIAKAWTGKNLFKTADAFKSAQKSADKTAKSAKEINKQLAGFDEMNVLSDTSSSDGGGGGTDISTPNVDLTGLQGEVPEWLKWIVDHKDEILAVMAGVAAGLLAWQLGLSGIKALGFGVMIAGIVYTIESLLEYLKDPSWENFGKIIQGIGVTILGLGILIGSVPVIIAGAIILIVGTIVKYWEQIKEFLQKGIDWLKGKADSVKDTFGGFIGQMYSAFVTGLEFILNGFDDFLTGIKEIFDGIIKIVTGVFTGNWKKAWEGVKQVFKGIFKSLLGIVENVIGIILSLLSTIGATVGTVISFAFKAVINGILNTIETILNGPIKAVNSLIKVINKVPGINLGKLPTFNLPRLAKGGIINQPGRGVPVGSAIAGERGQEGVLPLTDSQQMQLLGEAIGRYVTINANITNMMNGRVISRELKKIDNTNNFAFNN